MRILSILLFLFCVVACKPKPPVVREPVPVSDDTTFLTGTFYIVRHAESLPGADTLLTAEGRQRVGALYRLLKDSGINKIYITPDRQTIATADSLRIRLHLDTCFYHIDTTGESFIYQVTRHEDWGKHILVVAHTHTILPILRSLKGQLPANSGFEADQLLIVRKYTGGTTVTEVCY
ncbi:histidine phosphatase family protein [Chitinophaga sp. 30R24]|uniref:histidine phosphatase family protein n=1 Tax=Chitinophaga sp. 30R24 TaxID=3248838 RepID=UPI003B9125B7